MFDVKRAFLAMVLILTTAPTALAEERSIVQRDAHSKMTTGTRTGAGNSLPRQDSSSPRSEALEKPLLLSGGIARSHPAPKNADSSSSIRPATQFAPAEPDPTCSSGQCSRRRHRRGLFSRWKRLFNRRHRCEGTCDSDALEPLPFGQSYTDHFSTQVSNGDAARMVLYRFDFNRDGVELTWRGKQRLNRIAEMLPKNFHPVIVQATPGKPQLDEDRKKVVHRALSQLSFPIPEQRVRVGSAISRGLRGREAIVINDALLQQTTSGSRGGVSGSAALGAGGAAAPQSAGAPSRASPPTTQ